MFGSRIYNIIIPVDDCYDRDMRLVGGDNEMEGRVEVCNSHRWGTVCESYWTDRHTAVVCRHLGFSDTVGGWLKQQITLPSFACNL